ncbi:VacJ family lipoprotein [Lichenicola cladoniae]|uniref:VacJ family lipoprotein n=1 Tax=Lichenicola cladoniae TaxID=1484109 RepID=A0A6M8HSV6_9PROT|nr:VacJ family lipoprotein [Lichenicola cladoniae]NPD65607.1 VacJ family lipoprotein [Acetobacteraceae bacterium]QKE91356.1 VacJ family lipoprotein [Lichenicola cladoniae]
MQPETRARRSRKVQAAIAASLSLLALGACATKPANPALLGEYNQSNDPLEPTNRFFYRVGDTLDAYTLRPVAQGYVWAVPLPVRTGIHNVLRNLNSPVVFFNDVFETKPRRAGDTFVRFVVNSTIGIGGVLDVAKGWGYPAHTADGGMTLANWGLPQGPYLFLPLLGPSSPRALTGFGIDIALSPFTYVPRGYGLLTFNWARYGVGVIDARSQVLDDLDQLKRNALDPYATIRSLYRQHRSAEIQAMRDDHRTTVPDWYSH